MCLVLHLRIAGEPELGVAPVDENAFCGRKAGLVIMRNSANVVEQIRAGMILEHIQRISLSGHKC